MLDQTLSTRDETIFTKYGTPETPYDAGKAAGVLIDKTAALLSDDDYEAFQKAGGAIAAFEQMKTKIAPPYDFKGLVAEMKKHLEQWSIEHNRPFPIDVNGSKLTLEEATVWFLFGAYAVRSFAIGAVMRTAHDGRQRS